jgi:sulfite oxidase
VIVHRRDPLNAETPRADLAASPLTPADRFYVRNHGSTPHIDDDSWRVEIDGLARSPRELSLDDLRALPRREVLATLQCAGNRRAGLIEGADIPGQEPWGPGATGTARWGGAALADVIALVEPTADAMHVAFTGADVSDEAEPSQLYATSIPLRKALAEEVLLAWEMNGEPLPAEHGAPVRVVVPGYIGARSVKWVQGIELRGQPSAGWFQDVVYRLLEHGQEPAPGRGIPLGEVALNSDVLVPDDGAHVPAGATEVCGYAFAGGERFVVRVDVTIDGGRTWTTADLLDDQGHWAWRRWRCTVGLPCGAHTIQVRAWDSAGATQPSDPAQLWNPQGYINNSWGRATVHAG